MCTDQEKKEFTKRENRYKSRIKLLEGQLRKEKHTNLVSSRVIKKLRKRLGEPEQDQ